MKTMDLFLLPTERRDGMVRRSCRIERRDGGTALPEQTLWFEFPEPEQLPDEEDGEAFLTNMLLQAMQEERQLTLHGKASRRLLSNLTELRDAWALMVPDRYTTVDVDATGGEPPTPAVKPFEAVAAFSGGVDSAYTVWTHSQGLRGHRSHAIRACVMVHGFDIPLTEDAMFRHAFDRAEAATRSIGIPLLPLRTNYRVLTHRGWKHMHGLALAAAMQQFKGIAGTALVASSASYDFPLGPWGSSAAFDHLYSGGGFEFLHDGAATQRRAKSTAIADWPEGYNSLRVCWQGADPSRNCGHCEKCVRTLIDCLILGLPAPKSLPSEPDLEVLRTMELDPSFGVTAWTRRIRDAEERGIDAPWMDVVRDRLGNPRPDPLLERLKHALFPNRRKKRP